MARVNGRPLVLRACDAALGAYGVDHVVVSSDWADVLRAVIAEYSMRVMPLQRPSELANDEASLFDVIAHHIAVHEIDPDVVVLVQPTAALVNASDVSGLVSAVRAGADSAILATPFDGVVLGKDARPVNISACAARRRQERAPQWLEVGCYAWRSTVFGTGVYAGRCEIVEVPRRRGIDVDDAVDLVCAEALVCYAREGAE
jgi:CMP-N-acetylneuraminic acid synthetase